MDKISEYSFPQNVSFKTNKEKFSKTLSDSLVRESLVQFLTIKEFACLLIGGGSYIYLAMQDDRLWKQYIKRDFYLVLKETAVCRALGVQQAPNKTYYSFYHALKYLNGREAWSLTESFPCKGEVRGLAISSDGQKIITGGEAGVLVWSKEKLVWNEKQTELVKDKRQVASLALSRDGERLAFGIHKDFRDQSGPSPGSLVVTRGEEGEWVSRQNLPGLSVTSSIAISGDGERIVTGSSHGSACVWQRRAGDSWESTGPLNGYSCWDASVAISADGNRIVTAADKSCLWQLGATGRFGVVRQFSGHVKRIACVAMSLKGDRIVTGSDDYTARVWSETSKQWTGSILSGHFGEITSVAISADGRRIVTGSLGDFTARVWRERGHGQWTALSVLCHEDSVTTVAIFPDGEQVVTTSWDERVRLWNVNYRLSNRRLLLERRAKKETFSMFLDLPSALIQEIRHYLTQEEHTKLVSTNKQISQLLTKKIKKKV